MSFHGAATFIMRAPSVLPKSLLRASNLQHSIHSIHVQTLLSAQKACTVIHMSSSSMLQTCNIITQTFKSKLEACDAEM